ncbi:hypothetical protein CDAR_478121 [Caerostris darwini]|uniref:Uncharacterized protein n=1 Tax=Caerostris darwini TaxID=1538125 RepID=A0AAV4UK77_9ARAC|nr:hypothetical protein CDAR_478121 [Caerostris darwini]
MIHQRLLSPEMQIRNQIRKKISAEKWCAFGRRINATPILRFMRVPFSENSETHGEAALCLSGKNPRHFSAEKLRKEKWSTLRLKKHWYEKIFICEEIEMTPKKRISIKLRDPRLSSENEKPSLFRNDPSTASSSRNADPLSNPQKGFRLRNGAHLSGESM